MRRHPATTHRTHWFVIARGDLAPEVGGLVQLASAGQHAVAPSRRALLLSLSGVYGRRVGAMWALTTRCEPTDSERCFKVYRTDWVYSAGM